MIFLCKLRYSGAQQKPSVPWIHWTLPGTFHMQLPKHRMRFCNVSPRTMYNSDWSRTSKLRYAVSAMSEHCSHTGASQRAGGQPGFIPGLVHLHFTHQPEMGWECTQHRSAADSEHLAAVMWASRRWAGLVHSGISEEHHEGVQDLNPPEFIWWLFHRTKQKTKWDSVLSWFS